MYVICILLLHISLPPISYSASSLDLEDTFTYQTSSHTFPSNTLLAEAILQLFKYFSWKTCTMISRKGDYGYCGLKLLRESYYLNVSIHDRLIFSSRLDKFCIDLEQTLEKRCRISSGTIPVFPGSIRPATDSSYSDIDYR